jgi:rSAM/selenodomain-associated transferase 2
MAVAVSIIIPTLNERSSINKTLDATKQFTEKSDLAEVIVVDGGSDDETNSIVSDYKISLLHAPRGRGSQMHAGANVAKGEILWFLHADTIPPPDAIVKIINAMADSEFVGGNFTISFDGNGNSARFLSWLYPNLRKIGLCYGDSAIFVRRDIYEKIGGFKPYPIFEDLDLISRISREGKLIYLPAKIVTSSRRFENRNFPLVFARWIILQGLYWLGVSPHALNKLYSPIRSSKK